MARRTGMPRSRRGHQAHLRMGLSRGNPMAHGGNYGRRRRGSYSGATRRRTTRSY